MYVIFDEIYITGVIIAFFVLYCMRLLTYKNNISYWIIVPLALTSFLMFPILIIWAAFNDD
jgi:succinate dehydrogenase hydrophobic anchor subunit